MGSFPITKNGQQQRKPQIGDSVGEHMKVEMFEAIFERGLDMKTEQLAISLAVYPTGSLPKFSGKFFCYGAM